MAEEQFQVLREWSGRAWGKERLLRRKHAYRGRDAVGAIVLEHAEPGRIQGEENWVTVVDGNNIGTNEMRNVLLALLDLVHNFEVQEVAAAPGDENEF